MSANMREAGRQIAEQLKAHIDLGGSVALRKQDQVLTPGEVARRMGVTPSTVSRWANAGLLPHFKTPGGRYRFYASTVTAAITEHAKP